MLGVVLNIRLCTVLAAGMAVLALGPDKALAQSDDTDLTRAFGNAALKGRFAWSLTGRYQDSVVDVSDGDDDNEYYDFSQSGYLDFNGRGEVSGDINHAVQSASGGGTFDFIAIIGFYSVQETGLVTVSLDSYWVDWENLLQMQLECVIVKPNQQARCVVTAISHEEAPLQPTNLPVSGLGWLERQKKPRPRN